MQTKFAPSGDDEIRQSRFQFLYYGSYPCHDAGWDRCDEVPLLHHGGGGQSDHSIRDCGRVARQVTFVGGRQVLINFGQKVQTGSGNNVVRGVVCGVCKDTAIRRIQ